MYTKLEANRIIVRRKQIDLFEDDINSNHQLNFLASLRSFPRIVWVQPQVFDKDDMQLQQKFNWIESAYFSYRAALHLPFEPNDNFDWYDAYEDRTVDEENMINENNYASVLYDLNYADIIFFASLNKKAFQEPSYFTQLEVVKQSLYFSVYCDKHQLYIYLDYLNWTNTIEHNCEQRVALQKCILYLFTRRNR